MGKIMLSSFQDFKLGNDVECDLIRQKEEFYSNDGNCMKGQSLEM